MDEYRIRLDGGFHNDVFHLVEREKVVRLSDDRRTKEMVWQELEWMNFLYENGVSVPKPQLTLESEGERVKAYFEFIKGDSIDVTSLTHWNENIFKQLGRITGRMHALSREFKSDVVHRPVWTVQNPDVFGIRGNLSPWIKENYDNLMDRLVEYEITPSTYGFIHNDFHQGNLIIKQDGTLTTIDFDECSFNWYAQDVAVVFYHAYWQHSSYNKDPDSFCQTFMSHFFTGYKEENVLHKNIIKQIPIFLKLREIYLYQLFIRKWNINHLKEWKKDTLVELENKIKSSSSYAGIRDFSIYA